MGMIENIDLNDKFSLKKDGDVWRVWSKEEQMFVEIDCYDYCEKCKFRKCIDDE